jgi:hypothetical protein
MRPRQRLLMSYNGEYNSVQRKFLESTRAHHQKAPLDTLIVTLQIGNSCRSNWAKLDLKGQEISILGSRRSTGDFSTAMVMACQVLKDFSPEFASKNSAWMEYDMRSVQQEAEGGDHDSVVHTLVTIMAEMASTAETGTAPALPMRVNSRLWFLIFKAMLHGVPLADLVISDANRARDDGQYHPRSLEALAKKVNKLDS